MKCLGKHRNHRYICTVCDDQRKTCVRCGFQNPNFPQNLRAGYPMWRHGKFYHLCKCSDNVISTKPLTEDGKLLAARRAQIRQQRRRLADANREELDGTGTGS